LTDFVFATTTSIDKTPSRKTKSIQIQMETEELQKGLRLWAEVEEKFPFANVMMCNHKYNNNGRLITGHDWQASYILPSAHFPLLLDIHLEPLLYQPHQVEGTTMLHQISDDDDNVIIDFPCAFVTEVSVHYAFTYVFT